MFGCDLKLTKLASIYGYVGRLFYIDPRGVERCMILHSYETIVLSSTSLAEPEYAIRYYYREEISGKKTWTVEFYDDKKIYTYKGGLGSLKEEGAPRLHMFDYCPLQAIVNNEEMLGDAEKVLAAIDDYDKGVSDNSNEIESFVHAYMIFKGFHNLSDKTIREGRINGAFNLPSTGTQQAEVSFLTKEINDAFTEHHLKRLEDNIYRFSKTPNLTDETFGNASGVSLKFKLHGLETKCGMFQANVMDAAQYMWQVLASAWAKREKKVDPLHVTMDFKRNFPLDMSNEATTAQALINAGFPKRLVYALMSFVDDVDEVMEEIEEEKGDNVTSLYDRVKADLDKNASKNGVDDDTGDKQKEDNPDNSEE